MFRRDFLGGVSAFCASWFVPRETEKDKSLKLVDLVATPLKTLGYCKLGNVYYFHKNGYVYQTVKNCYSGDHIVKYYDEEGKLHCEDGPAELHVYKDGSWCKSWYNHNKLIQTIKTNSEGEIFVTKDAFYGEDLV